ALFNILITPLKNVALVSTLITGLWVVRELLLDEDLLITSLSSLAFSCASSFSALNIFLSSISYALSLSIDTLYFETNLLLLIMSSSSVGNRISMRLIGARSIVAARGVGLPFSSRVETRASPIPNEVITSLVS